MNNITRLMLGAAIGAAPIVNAALPAFPEWSAPRAVTAGPHEHLLASYFAIDSWSPDKRHMLVLETDLNGRLPEAGERCTLGVVDTADNNRFIPVTTTACWNFQEAAMAFWIDDNTILFNDLREGKFKTVIMDWRTKQEVRVLPRPVSAVSEDRTWAVSINYARLSLTRPDYGYAGPGQDALETSEWPENDGLWVMDLKTGESKLILSIAQGRSQMPATKSEAGKPGNPLAYYCHTVIQRDAAGSHIFFLARSVNWFDKVAHKASRWETTAFTIKKDGSELRRCFKDNWGASHFNWAPDGSPKMLVTTWIDADKYGANWWKAKGLACAPVEFTVGDEENCRVIGNGVANRDWHCVYSPDGQFMSGETYYSHDANSRYGFKRPWLLVRLEDGATKKIGDFFVPEAYRGTYWRCDLHARYRPDGKQIAFNSVHEGTRQVYVMDITAAPMAAAEYQSLDGLWDFKLEQDRSLEEVTMPGFAASDKITVPGCWDTMSHWYNARGTGCYRTRFTVGHDCPEAYLVIDGCGIRSKYWLDGKELAFSKIPWARLEVPLGSLAAGEHVLEAALDSIVDNTKVKLFWDFYDFYAFGGFYHGVGLELLPRKDAVRQIAVRTRDYKTGLVELELRKGPRYGAKIATAADGMYEIGFDGAPTMRVAFKNGRARVKVPNFKLWSPDTPNLHEVKLYADGYVVSARFGVRQVGTEKGRITLNGERIYLKGVNRHEAHYEFGSTTPDQLLYEDIKNAKDLGCNFIRGSHYRQTDRLLELCDELGVMVWEESLGWGNGEKQTEDAEFCDLQELQTRMMVRDSINHPSVIISAFLNEPKSYSVKVKKLIDRLVDAIRAEDSGHLVTFACCYTTKDVCNEKTDIIAVNTYPCWYGYQLKTGTNAEMHKNIAQCYHDIATYMRGKYKDDRPIIVGEIGVKADYGVRDPRGKAQYTEDYQAECERAQLEELFANTEYGGVAIWQFTDAKTYTRRHAIVSRSYGVNTGGLYDLYRRPKLVVDTIRELFTNKSAKEE